ncbi:MAG: phage major capsid protein [Acetobacteraceae bacterium]
MALTIRQLLERRAKIAREMRDIVDQIGGDDETNGLSPEQQAAFDKLKAALADLENAIANRAAVDDIERRMAGTPVGNDRHLDAEMREFSLVRAIAGAAGMDVDWGREREIGQEIARRSGRQFNGIAVPMATMRRPIEQRAVVSTSGGGGVIGTYLDGSLYIDLLRAKLVIRRLGARMLTGLVSNVDIPRLSSPTAAGWVAENTALTETDEVFDKVSLRPKHAGAIVELSRNMLLQSTPDIEQLVRADMAAVLARTLDAAAIDGTGLAEDPVGIVNQSGVGGVAIGTNGGAMTWAKLLSMVETVELANAGDETRAWVGNPNVKAQLMQTPKITGVAGIGMVMDQPDQLAGYQFASTTLVPNNGTKGTGNGLSALIYGEWSDLLMGLWSELDILVNPYAEAPYSKGNVMVRAMMTVDIEVRHPQSFCVCSDIAAP